MTALVDWFNTVAFSLGTIPVTWLEVVGFITGAGCVWLLAKEHMLNWPLGILTTSAYLILFWQSGLFGDSVLQAVFIALNLWGWYAWLRPGTVRTQRPVVRADQRELGAMLLATAAATGVIYYVLSRHSGSTVPWLDALTTALSLVATYGQVYKRLQNWWFWIAADLIYIPLYVYKDLALTAVLYVVYLGLCVQGLRLWSRSLVSARLTVL